MSKEHVHASIEEVGIIPAVRLHSAEQARYAAEALHRAGIPIAEITMTVPGALEVISDLARELPEVIVGAGTVLDAETAQRCVDAGAKFLTSTGFVAEVVAFARKKGVLVIPGVLTPSEVIQHGRPAPISSKFSLAGRSAAKTTFAHLRRHFRKSPWWRREALTSRQLLATSWQEHPLSAWAEN